jgi:hypothetical protein
VSPADAELIAVCTAESAQDPAFTVAAWEKMGTQRRENRYPEIDLRRTIYTLLP